MAQVNAGRVRFVGRGEYDNSTQYYTFDLVNYNGNSYFAKSNTMGNLPTNSTYWQLVAEKGNKGDTGATGNGIASITKTSTSGLVDTYTITYTSGNTTTFNVTNGNGIDYILLTSRSGTTKVYTIYFTDGNTTTFTVQDGEVTQEVFDEEVERLKMVYNAMPKVSGEGTDLTLDNTAECPVYDVELSPSELEQATTTGKNLTPIKSGESYGITYVVDGDTVIANGTATNISRIYLLGEGTGATADMYLLQAGTYTLSAENTDIPVYIARRDGSVMASINSSRLSRSITLDEDTEIALFYRVSSGETLTNAKLEKLMFEIGDTASSYEPYTNGASPNPEFPQQIHTVSGENSVEIQNKNLLNRNTCSENKSLIWTNGTENTETGSLASDYIRVNIGDKIICSYQCQKLFYDKNKNYLGALQNNGTDIAKSGGSIRANFTVPNYSEIYYVRLGFRASYSSGTDLLTTDMMVNKGTTLLDYVPHQEQTYLLSLGDLEYCKIGDYEDLFFKNVVGSEYYDSTLELNKWYLKKNIGKTTDTIGSTSKTISDMINNATVYSYCGGTVSGTTITYTSALVVANYIYYPTTTPTNILLSDTLQTQLDNIQKAITYQDQMNVSQTNDDLPFVIKLSAIRDLSGIFELIQ